MKTILLRLLPIRAYLIACVSLVAIQFIAPSEAKALTIIMIERSSQALQIIYSFGLGDPRNRNFTYYGNEFGYQSVRIPSPMTWDQSSFQWLEDDNTQKVNLVTLYDPELIIVRSDVTLDGSLGTPFANNTSHLIGHDGDNNPIRFTFTDLAYPSERPRGVPENGATAPLLILSLIAMFGMASTLGHSRKPSLRP